MFFHTFVQVAAGGRPEPDVFEDFYEEVRGILAKFNTSHLNANHQLASTSAAVETVHENGIHSALESHRIKSIESFTLEEELKPQRGPSTRPVLQLPPAVHKDVEIMLPHLQAKSILDRVASSRSPDEDNI